MIKSLSQVSVVEMQMAPVRSPTDWLNLSDWDRYWSEVLADKFWTAVNLNSRHFERTSLRYLAGVKERTGHRVLLAGNGIAPEPYGFGHAGCEVVVVDVSAVACQFLASVEVSPELLASMFPEYDTTVTSEGFNQLNLNLEKSFIKVARERRPGGHVSIVNANLFSFEPEQPFHAIFSRRAYQGLPLDHREELARRFYRWLHPGGMAFVEMLNVRDRQPFEEPFRAAGFLEVQQWSQTRQVEKCVLFWHGSG